MDLYHRWRRRGMVFMANGRFRPQICYSLVAAGDSSYTAALCRGIFPISQCARRTRDLALFLENTKRTALGCPLLSALGLRDEEILAREFIAYDALLCGMPAARDFDRLSLILNILVRSVGWGDLKPIPGRRETGGLMAYISGRQELRTACNQDLLGRAAIRGTVTETLRTSKAQPQTGRHAAASHGPRRFRAEPLPAATALRLLSSGAISSRTQGPAPQSRTFPTQDTHWKRGRAFANRFSRTRRPNRCGSRPVRQW